MKKDKEVVIKNELDHATIPGGGVTVRGIQLILRVFRL